MVKPPDERPGSPSSGVPSTDTLAKATVIIRSVGERTEATCRRLILEQGVAEDAVFVIREAPFSQAMRVGFRIGLEQGRPWTFCVDADLLLRPGSIRQMLEIAEQQPDTVCEIQGYILDKFFGGPRTAGNHLYRTALLDRVLASIPAEGVNIRPEYHTLLAMEAQGFPWRLVPYLVGLHDFEQSHRDIFRKCLVQAHKHAHFTDLFLSIWRAGAAADDDYRVALAGFARGIEHHGEVRIDVRESVFGATLDPLGLTEKADMAVSEWPLSRIEGIVSEWDEPTVYRRLFPDRMGLDQREPPSRGERMRLKWAELGALRAIPYSAGWLLQRAGQRLQALVSR